MSLFQLSALRDKVSSCSYDIIVYNLHLTKSVFGSREKNGYCKKFNCCVEFSDEKCQMFNVIPRIQLHVQSMPINTKIVSSNLVQARCTRYNIM